MRKCHQCGKECKEKYCSDDCREWAHEIAMEAGMLHGMDAYNDALGQSTGHREYQEDD